MIIRLLLRSASLLAFGTAALGQAPRPNFVFIIGDDISAEDLGCYGNRGIRTPNLDRLAAESMRFNNG